MRIALLTEGAHPDSRSDAREWCDRLARGLPGHDFEEYVLTRTAAEQRHCEETPSGGRPVHAQPLWGVPAGRAGTARGRAGRRFLAHYRDLAAATAASAAAPRPAAPAPRNGPDRGPDPGPEQGPDRAPGGRDGEADRFASGLYGLAELAGEGTALPGLLRGEAALAVLEDAWRACGPTVEDLLVVNTAVERALRPLSAPWYGRPAPSSRRGPALVRADLCHAVVTGATALPALPGLLARHFFGVPLLLTEHGSVLRGQYLAQARSRLPRPVRALTSAFHRLLLQEAYHRAALVTCDHAHTRRWQERCGADPGRLRTVHPGTDPAPFRAVAEAAEDAARLPAPEDHPPDPGRPATVVWTGRIGPAQDPAGALRAFAEVRGRMPRARLRIVGPVAEQADEEYLAHCRELAARLFPDTPPGAAAGEPGDGPGDGPPVVFERSDVPDGPHAADVCASGDVVVPAGSGAGDFPRELVEAMLCGRATVTPDAGAAREVVGGTGLVVPPRNPRALAAACLALLADPARAARLGAAARSRALELFTAERTAAAFQGLYLELVSHTPAPRHRDAPGPGAAQRPFARPAEARLPGRWARAGARAQDRADAEAGAGAERFRPGPDARPRALAGPGGGDR
ncbi:DUF3492 domain-containing protein [Streptomyces sp. NPDC059637]|uniref:DUF3492 domain-containing protein n=1 Tax=Streptomyces sp. NPDC059637 TaxID=3347752 RepID=UPI00369E65F0